MSDTYNRRTVYKAIQSVDSSQSPTLTEAMTRPGVILGTVAYMSPEQAKGKATDRRADIWASGCILHKCLIGKRVFAGETVTETLAAILKGEPNWQALPKTTPQNIRSVIHRCLEKEADRRFHHAADLRIEMDEVHDPGEVVTGRKSSWLWKSIAVVFIAAFAALSFMYFRETRPHPKEPMRFEITQPGIVGLAPLGSFALSPDGRHLAFAAIGSDGIQRIWLRALDSLEAKPIIGTESDLIFLLWYSRLTTNA
jgi:serine/threonine protein kinase